MPPAHESPLQSFWMPWKRLGKHFYYLLSSMELAIVLLVTLAMACIVGSLFPQETLVDLPQIQRQFGDLTPYLEAMGFFNVFYSGWFITLEVLFFFSIAIGSFRWLRPAWRSIRLKTLMNARHIESCSTHHAQRISSAVPPPELLATLTMALEQEGFDVTPSSPKTPWSLYAQRGYWGRVGPMLTHLGIVLTLLASLYGAFTNFTAQVLLTPQASFTLAEAEQFNTSTAPPFWWGRVPEWEVVIQDFDITFQDKAPTIPKQFLSRLQVRDALTHEVLSEGVSSVNHPWVYDGVTFYQAQFSPTTQHQLRINGKTQIIDAKETLAGRPYAVLPIDTNRRLFIFPLGRFTDGLPENRLHILLEKNGVLLGYGKGFKTENQNLWSLEEGKTPQTIEGISIAYEKAIMATGLQIKYAPEVPLLYGSLILLALGCIVSFVPHHQVWFALSAEEQEGNAPPTRMLWYARSKKRRDRLETSLHRVLSRLPLL